ncbi:hypothetical protein AAFF_G00296710 [Aldrovandia affinis]|uniref:Uncharacterized protein n=1 Tax=Aldrovandia affinis TaxID=143900 RepID=A0AAD7WRW3_9TELE|nr:hypothetical protein AAFF_G00296710 [Aldrovandia affinis]
MNDGSRRDEDPFSPGKADETPANDTLPHSSSKFEQTPALTGRGDGPSARHGGERDSGPRRLIHRAAQHLHRRGPDLRLGECLKENVSDCQSESPSGWHTVSQCQPPKLTLLQA